MNLMEKWILQPILLRRLATFIVNVHKQQNKWIGEKKSKPFILGILNPATNYYTLLGLQCTKYGEGDMKYIDDGE